MAKHLARCETCRCEMRRIHRERTALAADLAMPEIERRRGLAGVLSSIADWRRNSTGAAELKSRLRTRIETYFGSSAILMVERSGMPAEELLGKTNEMLDVFLGQAAAEGIANDVLSGLSCARSEAWR
jgi:hypothetical protein